jgi:hypothetical protein
MKIGPKIVRCRIREPGELSRDNISPVASFQSAVWPVRGGVVNSVGRMRDWFCRVVLEDGHAGSVFLFRRSFCALPKPMHRIFKVMEGLDMQTVHPAEEGEISNGAINILPVKDRQPLTLRETGRAKGADQPGQFGVCKSRFVRRGQIPQIHHGAAQPALSQGRRQFLQHLLALFKIEILFGVIANKVARANNMQCDGHSFLVFRKSSAVSF